MIKPWSQASLRWIIFIQLALMQRQLQASKKHRETVAVESDFENGSDLDSKANDKQDGAKHPVEETVKNISLSKRDIYHAGFQIKRAHQLVAVKQLLSIQDYSKQYKMVKVLVEKILQVLATSKLEITQSSYIPGYEFPEKDQELHALAHVVENTAFLGDILLRLPDITHQILKGKKEWEIIINWSVGFCNETGLFDNANEKLLSLGLKYDELCYIEVLLQVAQELNLVPRDPDYINPYKAETLLQQAKQEIETANKGKVKQKKAKRKERKGPRLSRSDL